MIRHDSCVLIMGSFLKKTRQVPFSVFEVFTNTYIPSGAMRVALTPVARTLSMEANWISVAMVPMLTTFT